MNRNLPALLTSIVIVTCGIVHGVWTDRWAIAKAAGPPRMALSQVPSTIGEWDGRDQQVDPKQLEAAEIVDHISRVYVNRENGNVVNVFLVRGKMGPIAVHPPDICYAGAGFELTAVPAAFKLPPDTVKADGAAKADGAKPDPDKSPAATASTAQSAAATPSFLPKSTGVTGDFIIGDFTKPSAGVPTFLRIFWAWSGDGDWAAPSNPRIAYARFPQLYKMYITRSMRSPKEPVDQDPCIDFMRLLIPEVHKVIALPPSS